MPTTRIRIGSLPRGEPRADHEEGLRLRDVLLDALSRGPAPLVAVVLRRERVDLVETEPAAAIRLPLHHFLAGLARSETPTGGEVDAVGLMGVARVSDAARVALVFLEWPDCRWWSWRAAVEPSGRSVREDTAMVSAAVKGDRLPDGLGRWWSLARRARIRLGLRPAPPDELRVETSPLVH